MAALAIARPVTDGSLTKATLVEAVAGVANLTKKHAEIVVDTVFGNIVAALHRGEKVELRGFGSFRLRRREPHRGRNPLPNLRPVPNCGIGRWCIGSGSG